jgi:hypothetical protein
MVARVLVLPFVKLLALSLCIAVLRGQSKEDLLAHVIASMERLDATTCKVSVKGLAHVRVWQGRTFEPSESVEFEYATEEGRVLLSQTGGADLDDYRNRSRDPFRRLMLPTGVSEVMRSSGLLELTTTPSRSPRELFTPLAPNEFIWSFASSHRNRILKNRHTQVVGVDGDGARRKVRIESLSSDGSDRWLFVAVEDWDWLVCELRMFVPSSPIGQAGEWFETYSISITDVVRTDLCYMPALGTMRWRGPRSDSTLEIETLADVSVEFWDWRFDGPSVPFTLAPNYEASSDPILAKDSFLATTEILRRGPILDEFFQPSEVRVGCEDWVQVWGPPVALCLAVIVIVFIGRKRRMVAWISTGLLALCFVCRADERSLPWSSVTYREAPDALRSKYLCGADAMYAFARCAKRSRPYLEILRLVRPGHSGCSLQKLADVAEAEGLDVEIVNPRRYKIPPVPLLCHIHPGHFIVIIEMSDNQVRVFDSSRGLLQGEWRDLSQCLSPLALALREVN